MACVYPNQKPKKSEWMCANTFSKGLWEEAGGEHTGGGREGMEYMGECVEKVGFSCHNAP